MLTLVLFFSFLLGTNASIEPTKIPLKIQPAAPVATASTTCPYYGYSGDENDGCYIYSSAKRNYAYNLCASKGAYLFDVKNAFQNSQIQQIAGVDFYWLGMTCTDNDITDCMWDFDVTELTLNSYSNFYGGKPNVTAGPCVYLKISDGKWYSADCSFDSAYFGCKKPSGIWANTVPQCVPSERFGYHETYNFRGKCYWGSEGNYGYSYAQNNCNQNCGNIASIHSLGENMFVKSLGLEASNYGSKFIYTGLKSLSNTSEIYSWEDGTLDDFEYFGYKDNQMGSCVTMAMNSDLIPIGKWINSGCSEMLAVVCAKDWENGCDVITPPAPTLVPSRCPSILNYTGNGTIYSPGYPNGMDSSMCEYIITVDQSQIAQIYFPEISLSWDGALVFYNDLTSSTPFTTLSYVFNKKTVISPTNMIRMYYNASSRSGSSWIANYGPVDKSQICTSPFFYTQNGTIASPGYPAGDYAPNSCEYVITVDQGKYAQITFTDLNLNYNSRLSFYSDIFTSYPFKTLDYDFGSRTIVSSTNIIKMVFNTSGGDGSYWAANYGPTNSSPTSFTTPGGWWTTNLPATITPFPNCGKSYYYSGTVTSPNFPNPYPSVTQSCSNTLNAMQYATCIVFDTMDLRYYDYVTLYDGYEYTGLEIARFTGYDSAPGVYCSRYYSAITLVFTTSSNSCCSYQKGFSARFAADAASLDGTRPTYETPTTTTWYWLVNKKAN